MRLMLLKDLIESTNRRWQTNKKQLTSDTILITTNAMHVFRTIFPHIYKCNATRMKKKNIQTNKQPNLQQLTNGTGSEQNNNQVGHAQFPKRIRPWQKKTKVKRKEKQSKPTVSAQPKQKTYKNERKSNTPTRFLLSSYQHVVFILSLLLNNKKKKQQKLIITCYM